MNYMNLLLQHNAALIKASTMLRKISSYLRKGDLESAIELRAQYKNEIEPLLQGLGSLSRD
jgi:hypothetical protein